MSRIKLCIAGRLLVIVSLFFVILLFIIQLWHCYSMKLDAGKHIVMYLFLFERPGVIHLQTLVQD